MTLVFTFTVTEFGITGNSKFLKFQFQTPEGCNSKCKCWCSCTSLFLTICKIWVCFNVLFVLFAINGTQSFVPHGPVSTQPTQPYYAIWIIFDYSYSRSHSCNSESDLWPQFCLHEVLTGWVLQTKAPNVMGGPDVFIFCVFPSMFPQQDSSFPPCHRKSIKRKAWHSYAMYFLKNKCARSCLSRSKSSLNSLN